MALINHETKEIHCKVLYTGPSLSGKTSTLRSVFSLFHEDNKNLPKFFVDTAEDNSDKYFEFLPLNLGKLKSYNVRLHLYTRPYWHMYEVLESLLFHNLDGIIYVLDSSVTAIDDNINELAEIRERLDDKGHSLSDFPQVYQYNKSDLLSKTPLSIMEKEFNPHHYPYFESIATQSKGVSEALTALSKLILDKLTQNKEV